ncbi:MAG: hypothetical protein J6S85_02720 [Methanobrevibacter sp.]|nr:hypothetical protein [Methanobrevibacter sp.]MBO7712453.1 hypothetical protein [Methanobrevibacter sp.]
MAEAKKCDRCGGFYIEEMRFPHRVIVEYPAVSLLRERYASRVFDVCPDCLKQLNEWFDNLKYPLIFEE